MEYEYNDQNVDYLEKMERLMKKQDMPLKEKQFIKDKHAQLKRQINH